MKYAKITLNTKHKGLAMIERTITPLLKRLAEYFPVVTIMGPRQSGKTTLAKSIFKNYAYVNLESRPDRQLAEEDPIAFFKQYRAPVIIDEIQRVPDLLSTIQVLVDQEKKKGAYILTGSHQPALHQEIAQSLAGRTAIAELLPLSIAELTRAGIQLERDQYILNGFMPRLYDENIPSDLLYPNYYNTYVEKDVRQLINLANQNAFETFLKLLAGRIGQVVNLNSMAGDIGVSSTTLASWLSVLEASYIVFRLPCYFNNFGKRLIKSPKIYFTEIGLATNLLGIEKLEQVARDPIFGGLFENMVVLEALKARFNAGKQPELYYFRDHNGLEVDLILNEGRTLRPFEIKSAMTWNSSFASNLKKFMKLSDEIHDPIVIYAGDLTPETESAKYINFRDTAKAITPK